MIKGKFIDNLPKVYGIYTGGFIVFIILMAIAEQAGMSSKAIGISFVLFTVAIYAIIGWFITYTSSRRLLRSRKTGSNCI